jgi:large subunit ribosomal protein L9
MATIKLLLNESIKNVGRVGDVVEVSPGFARNYLLPKGLAVQPTAENIKRIEVRRKEVEKLEKARREQQVEIIAQLASVEVTLERKTNEQGNLFGSVTATDIAKALQAQGLAVQPEDVNLPGRLDRVNNYTVRVKFADDLTAELKVWVAPDAESKALIDSHQKEKAKEQEAPAA